MSFLTVLQWNVQTSEELDNVCQYLAGHPADLICLQELMIGDPRQNYRHGPEFLANELGYRCAFVALPNISPRGVSVTLANAILSRGEIRSFRRRLLNQPDARIGFEYQSRGYIEADISIRGVELTVATTHLGYSEGFRMSDRRRAEVQQLMEELDHRVERFVLTGDFNAEPHSYVISEVSRKLKSAGPEHKLPTWTTKPFSYRGFQADELKWRLDYVFTSEDVRVVDTEILGSPFSDHLPILCRLSFE
jgi:endonuclease/exonuclease/phosphatase family metal-dependent hydrolase